MQLVTKRQHERETPESGLQEGTSRGSVCVCVCVLGGMFVLRALSLCMWLMVGGVLRRSVCATLARK